MYYLILRIYAKQRSSANGKERLGIVKYLQLYAAMKCEDPPTAIEIQLA